MKTLRVFVLSLCIMSIVRSREAFVINNLAETLSRIDLQTGAVLNHITALGEAPNQIAYYQDYLYVVNSISANIQKINPENFQVVHTIDLPIGSNPYYFDFDGNYCYMTGFISGEIYKINLTSYQTDDYASVGGFPEGIRHAGEYLYVTQTNFNPGDFSYGQGRIYKIDMSSMIVIDSQDVGKNPQWIEHGQDQKLHIVCTGNYVDVSGSVYIYDYENNSVSDSVLIGGTPSNLAISSNGIGYLAAGGWVDHGYVYAYDIYSGQILRGEPQPILVDMGTTAVAIDSLGNIYSCNFGADNVTKFNSAGQILATYNMGDGASGIVILDQSQSGINRPLEDAAQNLEINLRNYPNPFNANTIIEFDLGQQELDDASLEIYSLAGSLINSFEINDFHLSTKVIWDGLDFNGNSVSSGIYFARLNSLDKSGRQIAATKPMTLLR